MWVVPFKQIDFPVAFPFLELLLAAKRGSRRFVGLKPNQPLDLVSFREAGNESVLVFPNPPREIGSRADVKGPVGFAGEEIDVEHGFLWRAWVPTFVGMVRSTG